MHRVELKASNFNMKKTVDSVPNAPCGVESPPKLYKQAPLPAPVPNAPCGVESNFVNGFSRGIIASS